jgi:cystathionine gamma-synthase
MLDVVDIAAVAAVAHAAGAMFAVDNTFATPLLRSPLALGANLVMHSATNHIGGHSDLLLGVAIATDPKWVDRLRRRRSSSGATPGTLEAFLSLRGLRTLPVRLERAQATAAELADRFIGHPAIARVRYPGSRVDPFRDLVERQMSGGGTMVSFETHGGAADTDAVCAGVALIVAATSLGGVETSMERRAQYASERESGTPETLIRVSVGLEHVEDLWRDLDQALGAVRR